MKTYITPIHQLHQVHQVQSGVGRRYLPMMLNSTRTGLALLCAVTVATAAILISVWVAGTGFSHFFGAGIWGLGLIFLAMAFDNPRSAAMAQSITGVALLGAALLQSFVSPEFAIVAGTIIAARVGQLIFLAISVR